MSRRLPLFLLLYADALSVSLIVSLLGPLLLHPQTELFLVAEPYPVRSAAYGILLGVYSLLMVYAAPFLGHLSDRVGRRPVLLLGAAGVALGGLGAGAAVSSGLLLLLLASRILAGATAAGQATAQAALVEGSPPSTRGSAIS
ncbi:MAG TPA: MFS transporter, partial [Candidatus Nitrosotenuis sp.]|nr:MFS transporter [Candidatus Nitrosotenuis sp.]